MQMQLPRYLGSLSADFDPRYGIIPDSLVTYTLCIRITAPQSPAGLEVQDCSIQGTSRARSFPFFIISIA